MSDVKNSYPELPEIPVQITSVSMDDVINYGRTLDYPIIIKAIAYAIFRNESANGTHGTNNNYAGIQADVGKWSKLPGNPVATSVKHDGEKLRRFLCFKPEDGYKISFALLCIKAQDRGILTPADYFAKWVGNTNKPKSAYDSFNSMVEQGKKRFA